MLRWIATIWLGFVVIRYGSTTLKTLRAPFNPGLDIEWAGAWLAFLFLAVLSLILLKSTNANRLWLAVLAMASLVTLTLSHSWIPALAAMAILVVCAGSGRYALARAGVTPAGFIEGLVLCVPVGLGILSLGQLMLALVGLFNPTTSWLLIGMMAVPSLAGVPQLFRALPERGIDEHPIAVIPLSWIFFLNLLWALAPEVQFDAASVHLAVPRIYLEAGRLIDLPYFFHSYFAHLLNMVFGLCLATGGAVTAKLLVLGLGALAACGVFVTGQRLFNSESGLWSALIFYSTPMVIWLSGTTYVDLAVACFVVAAFLAFIRWFESREWGWMVVAGWISGVAVGTKLVALTLLGVLPFAILWFVWKQERRFAFREVVAYGLALMFVAIPWFAVVYALTGNPVYPILNAVFQSPRWELENTSMNAASFGIGFSAKSLLRLPFWLTWDSIRFGEGLPRGGLGFALLLAFPFGLLLWKSRPEIRVVLAAVVLHFAFWSATFQYGRYLVPSLPFLALVGCGVFLGQTHTQWNRTLLFAGVLAQVPVVSVMFWNIPERFPIAHAMGQEDSESLLSRGLGWYGAARYLNSKLQPGEKVVGVGTENLRFYLKAPLYSLEESGPGSEMRALAALEPGPELARVMLREGFRYVAVPVPDLRDQPPYYPYLHPEFVRKHAAQVYRDHLIVVLRICSDECGPDGLSVYLWEGNRNQGRSR